MSVSAKLGTCGELQMYSHEKSQPSAWGYANDAVNYSWEWHFNLFAPESFTTEVPELL